MTPSVTFTNRLGEVLAPMLLWMRDIGFFEWYVYIPVMTASAVGLFLIVVRTTDRNGTFSDRPRRAIWLAAYFGLCFLATNGLAVGLKTLIVEELDYTTRVWFEAYLGPLHLYIVAVALSYLALIARNRTAALDWGLGLFVQLGLLAGVLRRRLPVAQRADVPGRADHGPERYRHVRRVRPLQRRSVPAVRRSRLPTRATRLTIRGRRGIPTMRAPVTNRR